MLYGLRAPPVAAAAALLLVAVGCGSPDGAAAAAVAAAGLSGAGSSSGSGAAAVAKTPPMGWNSWNSFGCGPKMTSTHIKTIADTLVSTGLAAAGYEFVNLDDCWASAKRAGGATPLHCAAPVAHR